MCVPTAYAKAEAEYTNDDYKKGGEATCMWRLRSLGFTQVSASYVLIDGSVRHYGSYVDRDSDCVRPALWIKSEMA